MPWSYPDNIPQVAQNWTEAQQRRCIEAANAVLEETGDEEQAIFACIAAAGKEQRSMEKKTFRGPLEIKADSEQGEFKATFSKLNVKDHDGDVTVPGAFTEGQEVIVEGWNHDYRLPVGKGAIHSDKEKAWIDGQFLLDTQVGREHYLTVKALGGIVEWSYTFNVQESSADTRDGERVRVLKKLDVWGVAPVTRGAGIGTQTTAIKSSKSDGDGDNSAEDEAGNGKSSGEVSIAATRIALDIIEYSE